MMIRKTTGRRRFGVVGPRVDKRYDDPTLLLELDGRCVHTLDWSFGGFKISGLHGVLPLGREVEGRLIRPGESEAEEPADFRAKVILCDPASNATRLRFTMIGDAAFGAMERALVRRPAIAA